MHSEAWLAGYREGFDTYGAAIVRQIIVPKHLREPAGDFMVGFMCGSRDARDAEIMDTFDPDFADSFERKHVIYP